MIANMLETAIHKMLNEMAKKKDEMLFAAFEEHGYSREWIMNPDNGGRIMVYGNANDPDVTIWVVDDKPLFELVEKIEWNGLKANGFIDIRYIAEVEESG